jgi:hypothetical protein
VLGKGHSGKSFFKKTNFFPECCTRGRVFFWKKKRPAVRTALTLPRVLRWHSGKASPSVRFLALEEGLFPVERIPGSSSPSVALGEGFPECFSAFPEWALGEACVSRSVRSKLLPVFSWDWFLEVIHLHLSLISVTFCAVLGLNSPLLFLFLPRPFLHTYVNRLEAIHFFAGG